MSKTKKTTEAPAPLIGRPPIPEEDRAKVSSIRLTPARWAKFHLLGGARWLSERIDRARMP